MMNNADAYLFTSQWKKSSLNQLFFEAFQGKMRFDVIAGMRPAGTPCNCMATILRSARDRLGSVSLTTDDQGYLLSQARYTPYGQVRWNGNSVMPTKFAFTSEIMKTLRAGNGRMASG
jgi:hypothetical protein